MPEPRVVVDLVFAVELASGRPLEAPARLALAAAALSTRAAGACGGMPCREDVAVALEPEGG